MYRLVTMPKLLFMFCILSISSLHAIEMVQTIELKKGWNAVYLKVDPVIENQDISKFIIADGNNSIPIEIITTFISTVTTTEFIKSQDEPKWKEDGWFSWINDNKPESFLTNLYDLQAGRAYLVKSSKDYTWNVKGNIVGIKKHWNPTSYNLTGFFVGNENISFYQYFQNTSSAEALKNGPIYSLEDGKWEEISMVDTAVEPNKAYWVYSNKGSNFQSTVEVTISNHLQELEFLNTNTYQTIYLKNSSTNNMSVDLTLEQNTLPLALVTKNNEFETILTPILNSIGKYTLEPNEQVEVKLAIKRENMSSQKEEGIVKISIKESNEVIYLPVRGYGVQQ